MGAGRVSVSPDRDRVEKKGKYGKKKSRVSNPAGRVSLCSPIEYVFP